MAVIDTFFYLFEADTKGAEKNIKDLEFSTKKLGEEAAGMAKKFMGFFGLGLSVAGIIEFVGHTAKANFELEKLAARLGTTVEAANQFRDAATLLGISEEVSTNSLKSLGNAIADSAMGMGRAKKVFEELGVQVTDSTGKVRNTLDVMSDLSKKMTGLSQGQKLRIMERLGLDPAMLKMMTADMTALNERMKKIDEASGFNLEKATKLSGEYTKAQKDMKLEINSLRMYAEKMFDAFAVNAMPGAIETMKKAKEVLHAVFEFLLQHKNLVVGFFVAVSAAVVAYFLPSMISAAIATTAATWPFILAAVVILALAAAFAVAYEDIMAFANGQSSLIGDIVKQYPIVGEMINKVVQDAKDLWDTIVMMWHACVEGVQAMINIFKALGLAIANGFEYAKSHSAIFRAALRVLSAEFQFLKNVVTTVFDWILAKISAVMGPMKSLGGMLKSAASWIGGKVHAGKETSEALLAGQEKIAAARQTPIANMTSQTISNSQANKGDTNVTTGPISIQTQATDADGIAKSIGNDLHAQVRKAAQAHDDGVAY